MGPIGQLAVVVSAGEPALMRGLCRGEILQRRSDVRVRSRVRAEHDCGSSRLGGGLRTPRPVRETRAGGVLTFFIFWASADDHHGTNSTVPNWECARERDTTQPPALHDYLLGPANKSGAFFTEPVACDPARSGAADLALRRPTMKGNPGITIP